MHRSRYSRGQYSRDSSSRDVDYNGRTNVPTYRVSLGKGGNDRDPHAYFSPRGGDYVYPTNSGRSIRDGWVSETIDYSNSYRFGSKRTGSPGNSHEPRSYSSSRYMDTTQNYNESRRPATTTRLSSRQFESAFAEPGVVHHRNGRQRAGYSAYENDSYGAGYLAERDPSLKFDRYMVGRTPSSTTSAHYQSTQQFGRNAWEQETRSERVPFSPPVSTRSMPARSNPMAASEQAPPIPMRARRDSTPYRAEISKLATQALFLQDQGRFEEARKVIDEIDQLQEEAELVFGSSRIKGAEITTSPYDQSNGFKQDTAQTASSAAPQMTSPVSSTRGVSFPSDDSARKGENGHTQRLDRNSPERNTVSTNTPDVPCQIHTPIPTEEFDRNAVQDDAAVQTSPVSTEQNSGEDIVVLTDSHDTEETGKTVSTQQPANINPEQLPNAQAQSETVTELEVPEVEKVDQETMPPPVPMLFSPILVEDDQPVQSAQKPRKASIVLNQVQADHILQGLDEPTQDPSNTVTPIVASADDEDDDIPDEVISEELSDDNEDGVDEVSGFGPEIQEDQIDADEERERASSLVRDPEIVRAESEYGVHLIFAPSEKEEALKSLYEQNKREERSNTIDPIPGIRTMRPQDMKSSSNSTPPVKPAEVRQVSPKPTAQPIAPAAGEVMLTKTGYMKKAPPQNKFNRFARWHRRYFFLSGRSLIYFKNEGSSVPRGFINLEGTTITGMKIPKNSSKSSSRDEFEVRIYLPDLSRTHRLVCATREEALEWITAITNNNRLAGKKADVPPSKKKEKSKAKYAAVTKVPKELIGKDITDRDEHDKKLWEFYTLLNVSRDATLREIRKSYHKLARKLHPDKNPNDESVVKLLAHINRAYQCLKDDAHRAEYDLCEKVKTALRCGLLVTLHRESGPEPMVIMLDSQLLHLYYQPAEHGTVLAKGYGRIELRFLQSIPAGRDGWDCPIEIADRCMTLQGARLGVKDLHFEFDTPEARNQIMDGMRIMRSGASQLFKEKLAEMHAAGMR